MTTKNGISLKFRAILLLLSFCGLFLYVHIFYDRELHVLEGVRTGECLGVVLSDLDRHGIDHFEVAGPAGPTGEIMVIVHKDTLFYSKTYYCYLHFSHKKTFERLEKRVVDGLP